MRMLRSHPPAEAGGYLSLCAVGGLGHRVRSQPKPPKDFVAVDETQPGEQIPALP